MERFAKHWENGLKIAKDHYSETQEFYEGFAEGFAIALTAKEGTDAGARN